MFYQSITTFISIFLVTVVGLLFLSRYLDRQSARVAKKRQDEAALWAAKKTLTELDRGIWPREAELVTDQVINPKFFGELQTSQENIQRLMIRAQAIKEAKHLYNEMLDADCPEEYDQTVAALKAALTKAGKTLAFLGLEEHNIVSGRRAQVRKLAENIVKAHREMPSRLSMLDKYLRIVDCDLIDLIKPEEIQTIVEARTANVQRSTT